MGRKIPLVSFLCGGLTCHKTSSESPSYKNVKRDEPNSSHNAVAAAQTAAVDEIPNDTLQPSSSSDQPPPPPLPPPPGGLHMRAASYHHRSPSTRSSSVSKLVQSLSTRVLRNNGDGASSSSSSSQQENKISENFTKKDKKLKHEDSIWKKTIILGEKCRVPDEDDGNILYDEKGNRISTYHSKSPSAVFSSSSSSRHGSQG